MANLMLSEEIDPDNYAGLLPGHFAYYAHRLIYDAILYNLKERGSATPAGVEQRLRGEASLQTAGGEDYLYEIIEREAIPTTGISEASEYIQRHDKLRQIATVANSAIQAAKGSEGDLAYAEEKARSLLNLLESRTIQRSPTTNAFEGILSGARETFKPAVATGWDMLDKCVKFSPGRLIVLGARPGVGKTTMATQLATQMLLKDEEAHILYCSVEMDSPEIGLKAISMLSGTNCVAPYEEENESEIRKVELRAGNYANLLTRMEIYYGSRLDKLLNTAHRMHKKKGLKMVVVDFISSIIPPTEHATKSEAIGSISKALKDLARRLGVPVLACSQLNRGTTPNKRPTMKDLRDSGEIEQDADIVILLHRPNDEEDSNPWVELIVEKNRFGRLTSMKMEPDLNCHRFRSPVP